MGASGGLTAEELGQWWGCLLLEVAPSNFKEFKRELKLAVTKHHSIVSLTSGSQTMFQNE